MEIILEIKNTKIESFLKSFLFSFLLFLYPAFLAFIYTRSILKGFDFFELLWLIYNVTLAALFLIRTRPSIVSMNPVHWTVALITSFSGFFFIREGTNNNSNLLLVADVIIFISFVLGLAATLILGRSMDFLPALRRVKTKYLYQIVRHPMYLASIIIKLGYVLKNPSIYNALLLVERIS